MPRRAVGRFPVQDSAAVQEAFVLLGRLKECVGVLDDVLGVSS
jgi:hypothetical protein